MLRHAALPLVAFAEPRSDGSPTLTSVDRPDLAAAVVAVSDLHVLTVDR